MHHRPLVAIVNEQKITYLVFRVDALKFWVLGPFGSSTWLDGTVWMLIQHMTHFICLVSPSVHIIGQAMKLGVTVCHLGGIRSGKHHHCYHIPTSPYVIQWFSSYTFNLKSTCYLLLYTPFSGGFALPVRLSKYSLLVAHKSQKKIKIKIKKTATASV